MEIPLSSAPAYIETSHCCAVLSPTPPLVSPGPPSPGLPKSQTVTRSDRCKLFSLLLVVKKLCLVLLKEDSVFPIVL